MVQDSGSCILNFSSNTPFSRYRACMTKGQMGRHFEIVCIIMDQCTLNFRVPATLAVK
jgi:hypothetical protein